MLSQFLELCKHRFVSRRLNSPQLHSAERDCLDRPDRNRVRNLMAQMYQHTWSSCCIVISTHFVKQVDLLDTDCVDLVQAVSEASEPDEGDCRQRKHTYT